MVEMQMTTKDLDEISDEVSGFSDPCCERTDRELPSSHNMGPGPPDVVDDSKCFFLEVSYYGLISRLAWSAGTPLH